MRDFDVGWQELVTLAVAAVAGGYLAWRGWQTLRGRKQGGCGSCGSCPPAAERDASKAFVPVEQLWKK